MINDKQLKSLSQRLRKNLMIHKISPNPLYQKEDVSAKDGNRELSRKMSEDVTW